jgi:hypothetical protein
MRDNRGLNRHQQHIEYKHPVEDPHYSILRPEKPDLGNSLGGTTKNGDQMHGSYKQPWVEHDGVTDPTGDEKIG